MIVNLHDVVRRPIVTEKTNVQKENDRQITFEVARGSNRIEIARAIESIFDIKVSKVRTMQVKGKFKRRGRVIGKRRNWKKAIVTLMPGESVDFFEGI